MKRVRAIWTSLPNPLMTYEIICMNLAYTASFMFGKTTPLNRCNCAVGEYLRSTGVDNPSLYLSPCFAAALNGSVYVDQCSPISDTTILSAMTTGCDLMDHVKTQIVPASMAAALAALLWTLLA